MILYSRKNTVIIVIVILVLCLQCRRSDENQSGEDLARTREQLVEVNRALVKKDKQKIEGYIKKNNLEMIESPTGLWYQIINQGEGTEAKEGFWATINYKVYLLEGTGCYSSDNDGPKTFLIGKGGVEAGLEEGILLLNEGAKAKFIMPPHLAHGLPGDGHKIPARAIIMYEVELVRLAKQ